jgi:PAS domain S-box-containing protein
LNADRAYYFELHQEAATNALLISQKIEWAAPGVSSQLSNPELQGIPTSMVDDFIQKIEKDGFYSAITPLTKRDHLRYLLESQQILSFCMIPVYNGGELKGLIGFDDCHNYRHWNEAEISYLRTISNIIEQAYSNEINRFQVKDLDNRLNSMINHLPGVAYRCKADAKWTSTFLSNQFESMTGYSVQLMLQQKLFFADIIHPDDLAISYDYLAATNDEGVFDLQYRIVTQSGAIRFVQDKGTVFFNADGTVEFIEGILFDITESHQQREEIDKSLERLELVFRASNEAICDWDMITDHCVWGSGFTDIFGYDLQVYDNHLWSQNIHPDDKNSVIEAFATVMADAEQDLFYMEYRFLRASGEVAFIQHRGIFQRNNAGKAVRLVASFRDVTDIKESEHKVQLKNNQLREIAWMQSHQLRAPLARILALLQLLELEGRLTDGVIDEFKLIEESAVELDKLIKSVVDKTTLLPLN